MRTGGEAEDDDVNNSDVIINLTNMNMPFLNIVAEKDDLVAPEQARLLMTH